jgi:hypothetical protein
MRELKDYNQSSDTWLILVNAFMITVAITLLCIGMFIPCDHIVLFVCSGMLFAATVQESIASFKILDDENARDSVSSALYAYFIITVIFSVMFLGVVVLMIVAFSSSIY